EVELVVRDGADGVPLLGRGQVLQTDAVLAGRQVRRETDEDAVHADLQRRAGEEDAERAGLFGTEQLDRIGSVAARLGRLQRLGLPRGELLLASAELLGEERLVEILAAAIDAEGGAG